MLYKSFVDALINALIHRCTCAKERKNPYPNFIPDIVNINFPQIWRVEVKGTEWVGLELNVTVGRFDK